MAKENIFDLSKILASTNNDIEVTNDSNKKTNDLLVGYKLLDPSEWDKIPYKSHIRYMRTDGELKKGGYVMATVHTTDLEGKPTIKIDLVSGFLPKAIKWSIYKGNINKIWVKIESAEQTSQTTPQIDLTPIKADIVFCKQSIEQINKKLQQMENENKRILMLIKKLHNIN